MDSNTTTSPALPWSASHHAHEHATALLWLLDRELIDEDDARAALAQGPWREVPRSVRAHLDEHAQSSFNDHRIGTLVLRWLVDLDRPMRARAAAAAQVSRDMLRPGSPIATATRSIESHYDPAERLTLDEADRASRNQLQGAINSGASHEAWTATPTAGKRVGDTVTFASSPVPTVTTLILGAALIASVPLGGQEDGSGWIPIVLLCGLVLAGVGALRLVRRPRVELRPAGIHVRGLLRSRDLAWSALRDVDLEVISTSHWPLPDQHHERVDLQYDDAGQTRTLRLISLRSDPELVRNEIHKYATERGVTIRELPKERGHAWRSGVGILVGAAIVAFIFPWGFGLCRGGDCGEGWIVTRLATKTSGAGAERVIEARYREMGAAEVEVTCPDRVSTVPDERFSCDVDGVAEFDEVEAHFTDRGRSQLAWDPVVDSDLSSASGMIGARG